MKRMSAVTKHGAVLLLILGCSQLSATLTYSGQAVETVTPTDVQSNAFEDDTNASVFLERSVFTTISPIVVDISLPGIYNVTTSFTPDTIDVGTQVETYLIHADPATVPGDPGYRTYVGTVTVDVNQVILGVILTTSSLRDSDGALGSTTTTYPGVLETFSGLEVNTPSCLVCGSDAVFLSADRRTLAFGLLVNNSVDQIRLVVGPAEVPEPSTAVLVGLGLATVVGLRKRYARRSAAKV